MMNELMAGLFLAVEILALFMAVTLAVQLFQARFGPDRLRAWMGGRPVTSALKGIALGFVTPFCTFTAIPMLIGLRQARVPAAGYVAFIVAAPVLDPVLFGALAIIAGLETAFVYAAVTFTAAIGLALAAERFNVESRLTPVDSLLKLTDSSEQAGSAEQTGSVDQCSSADRCGSDSGCGSATGNQWRGLRAELPGATKRSLSLLTGIAPILIAGVALSMVIEALVPADVAQRLTAASPAFSVPIAAALGTPLYVSTTLFVPIAEALGAAGVGIGAIVALTIAGSGANLPEFVMLSKLARPHVIGVFVGYVFAVAVAGGLLTQTLIG